MNEIIALNKIAKSFGNVKVISNISFSIEEGKVYALVGENGAGKSTICNIISGSLQPTEGSLIYQGKEYDYFTIQQAKEIGIKMVHQELQILPLMNVEENIFLGEESSRHGFADKNAMRSRTKELLDMVGLDVSPTTKVKNIEIAGRQLIEIAKAVNKNAKIVILDEPTSSLSNNEIEKLFTIVKKLKKQGVSFIFISHRLEEVFELSDEIIVFKDGAKVAQMNSKDTNEKEVIRLMVGREYSDFCQRERKHFGQVYFEIQNVSGEREGLLNNSYLPQKVSLKLEEGEVLGIAGLVGAGRTELIKIIFGALPKGSGKILIDGQEVIIKNSRDAIKHGMAWITEDRKQEGLILPDSITQNIALPTLRKHRNKLFIDDKALKELSKEYIEKLHIKTTGGDQQACNLSGGNQQKVVLGKWLSTNPKILILDEPTRGIDVGAKAEIYKLINELTEHGMAIILISSELPEVMGISDRMLIMYEGKVTGCISREQYSEELIMQYATGRKVDDEKY
ncbi:MAG: sugar ABC transporter ATP-binding protein [Hespellia sp.]|nr:sugar ABC transporter ATP-binding protein [Hespellia sp.]